MIRYAWLSLTGACQNNCVWCYEQHLRYLDLWEMPHENAILQVELLAQLGVKEIMLLGGEPTLYPNLIDVVSRAKELGMSVGIITNGRIVGYPQFMPTLEAIDTIAISFYSLDPETHNRITQAAAWDDTIAGMAAARRAGKICAINLVVGQENYGDAVETLGFLLECGFPTFVSYAHPKLCTPTGMTIEDGALHPQEFAILVGQCVDKFGIEACVKYVFEAPLCFLEPQVYKKLFKARRIDTGCKVSKNRIVITTSGKVVACNTCPIEIMPELTATSGFLEDYEKAITKARRARLKHDCCKGCMLWRRCLGGCPNGWHHWVHDDSVSPIKTL